MAAIKHPEKVSSFQERFSQLFYESGKSITELGAELHVSNQTVSAWKTGTRFPREPAVLSIADYFDVDHRWLMGFDVERRKMQSVMLKEPSFDFNSDEACDEDLEIQSLWRRASPAAKRAAIAVLKSLEWERE